MVSKKINLALKDGLHARPASEIIQFLKNFKCSVKMNYDGKTANCKSIISLLALGVKPNSSVEIVIDGQNENEELNSFAKFLEGLGR
jgi:phosphotransferase system HPr (HPr) family protein